MSGRKIVEGHRSGTAALAPAHAHPGGRVRESIVRDASLEICAGGEHDREVPTGADDRRLVPREGRGSRRTAAAGARELVACSHLARHPRFALLASLPVQDPSPTPNRFAVNLALGTFLPFTAPPSALQSRSKAPVTRSLPLIPGHPTIEAMNVVPCLLTLSLTRAEHAPARCRTPFAMTMVRSASCSRRSGGACSELETGRPRRAVASASRPLHVVPRPRSPASNARRNGTTPVLPARISMPSRLAGNEGLSTLGVDGQCDSLEASRTVPAGLRRRLLPWMFQPALTARRHRRFPLAPPPAHLMRAGPEPHPHR